MGTVTSAGCFFAECRRKKDCVHPLRQIVFTNEVASEGIVDAVADYEFNFIVGRERCQIVDKKSVGRPRVRTLHVYDLDDSGWNPRQGALSAGLEKDLVFILEKIFHERQQLTLLEHGFAAGDFHQTTVWAETVHFDGDFFRGHFPSAMEGVFTIAPGAAQ